jgi:hypothetical protein
MDSALRIYSRVVPLVSVKKRYCIYSIVSTLTAVISYYAQADLARGLHRITSNLTTVLFSLHETAVQKLSVLQPCSLLLLSGLKKILKSSTVEST